MNTFVGTATTGTGMPRPRYDVVINLYVGNRYYGHKIYFEDTDFHNLAEDSFKEKVKEAIYEAAKQAMTDLDSGAANKYSTAVWNPGGYAPF